MPQLTIPDKLRNWNHDIWGLVSRDWHLEWPGHYSQFLRCFQSYRNSINWICLSKKRTYFVTAWVENMFVELTEESQNKGHEYPGAHNQVTSGIKSPQPWPTVPKTSVLDSVSFNYFTFFHRWFYPGILQVYKYALSGFNRHLQMNNGFPSHTPSEWSPPPTWRQEKDWTIRIPTVNCIWGLGVLFGNEIFTVIQCAVVLKADLQIFTSLGAVTLPHNKV